MSNDAHRQTRQDGALNCRKAHTAIGNSPFAPTRIQGLESPCPHDATMPKHGNRKRVFQMYFVFCRDHPVYRFRQQKFIAEILRLAHDQSNVESPFEQGRGDIVRQAAIDLQNNTGVGLGKTR